MLLRLCEVERRHDHARLLRSQLREDVPAFVADEAVSVEALAVLRADAVGGDHWHDVRDGVTDHRSPPQA